MNPPKSLKEFKAQQKEKRKSLSKPIENLISDLKFNPAKFLSDYKNVLTTYLSKENQELKNLQEENLITLFIEACEENPEIKNIYKDFMTLASKGFLTLNKNKETFLFELARRNNLNLFLETILNLEDLNLLNDELLSVKNINSEICFSSIIHQIYTTNEKNFLLKKNYNNLLQKVFKLIYEKYKVFDSLSLIDKFNVFNFYTNIKLSEKSLNNLSKEDILKDFDIIFSSKENFDVCKIILYDKGLPYNLLISLLENEKFFDLIEIFIKKYEQNNFCNFPEIFFDFLLNLVEIQNYKNNMYFLPKVIPIIISEKNYERKIQKNLYLFLFSNKNLTTKEKNLLFNYLGDNLLKKSDDLIQKFLIQEDKEGFIPCIIYLLNNELNENDEKFFKENILDKTILDNKNDKYNKKLKYQSALCKLFGKNKINNFKRLFEFLDKNKLINLFEKTKESICLCLLNDIINLKITNDFAVSKILNFIINNFDQVVSFDHLKYLIKFLIEYLGYIKIEELKKIFELTKDKFIPEIKKEEEAFIEKIKKINDIEYKIINESLFSYKSKYKEFYKLLINIITDIFFNGEYELIKTKDILVLILDLIGVNEYNEVILSLCCSNEKFKPELIDIFIEKYYSKFNLKEDKYLQYFSLFNFQNSFNDNNRLKNNNCIYFFLRFIQGISNENTKLYYQNLIFALLNNYKYETELPLFYTEKEINELNNSKENSKDLFIKPKLFNDDVKLTLLSSLLDYNSIYKDLYSKFISKIDKSNIYSVIDKLNNNNNFEKIEFEFKLNEKYKNTCDLLKKHFVLKFYLCFFNSLMKKGKVFKVLNFFMKEISKILNEEKEFIDIANHQLEEFIKYNEFIKEKKLMIGMENDEIKNYNNIFGIDALIILLKKMIENKFHDEKLNLGKKVFFFEDIVNMKISYLKSFNLITNDEEEKLYILDSIIDRNKPIEKLQMNEEEKIIYNNFKLNQITLPKEDKPYNPLGNIIEDDNFKRDIILINAIRNNMEDNNFKKNNKLINDEMEKPLGVKNLNTIKPKEVREYYTEFIQKNYDIEKFILQFYNFNSYYFKKIPRESYIKIFKAFKNITEIIEKNLLIEKLFKGKNDLLKSTYEKIDFEDITKNITKEEDFNKSKDILKELKEIKGEINFKIFFDCLSRFYEMLIKIFE